MEDKKILRMSELVLGVKRDTFDPAKFPLNEWNRYLNILCGNRVYQKEAIKTSIEYLISEKYSNIEELVEENYYKNETLRQKYTTIDNYYQHIQLPHKKSGCIDLATATGKSYVIYGIAQIAMGLGLVDKVLVLGPPSTTIEKGLTEKFNALSAMKELRDAIPESSHCRTVEIINANQTIARHCICVENINAVYTGNSTSIKDSLTGSGKNCLVLNDEIHHAYNKTSLKGQSSSSIKKWKEFLLDETYNFKYILGFTGTAYIDNDYFNDVIYRYSLKDAINNGFVKTINYIEKNKDENDREKFQKILQNHQKNKETYSNIKPLTILITKDIREAKQLTTNLIEFLSEFTSDSREYIASKKVIRVTSDPADKENVAKLQFVDDKNDPTEWIISVAMLTEGWDVKNVFQIVPMEEKAFNSKLLIAQVLGRGLRLPTEYPKSVVTVYNHARWSSSITNLVREILETELQLKNSVLIGGERKKHHFELYNITYNKDREEKSNCKGKNVFNYKEYLDLESEIPIKESEITYLTVGENKIPFKQKYEIKKEEFLVSDIIDSIEDFFKNREHERFALNIVGEEYTSEKLPPRSVIEKYIRNSMNRAGITGEYVGKANRSRILKAFSTLLRKAPKTVVISKSPGELISIPTASKSTECLSLASLKNGASVFYSEDFGTEIVNEDSKALIEQIVKEREYRNYLIRCNPYTLKTPIDIVFTNGNPEEEFVTDLVEAKNCSGISSWIKSNNQGFYSLEYSITEGSHTTTRPFNPDFFILIKKDGIDYISVVEIKMDGDNSLMNKQKNKYAKEHFATLNEQLDLKGIKQHYLFNFLSPVNYAEYFQYVNDGRLIQGKFKSALDLLLEDNMPDSNSISEVDKSDNGIKIEIHNHFDGTIDNLNINGN